MNRNARKWIKALRSGKYRQGSGALATVELDIGAKKPETHYCCLGVACDLAIKAGIKVSVKKYQDNVLFGRQKYFLPKRVRVWLGLSTERGHFTRKQEDETNLADMNDEGCSFKEIAATIEQEPEGLFQVVKKKTAKKRKAV